MEVDVPEDMNSDAWLRSTRLRVDTAADDTSEFVLAEKEYLRWGQRPYISFQAFEGDTVADATSGGNEAGRDSGSSTIIG